MSRHLTSDNLVKLLGGILLMLMTWEGKCLFDKVKAIEATQMRICVRLGIEPIVREIPADWGALSVAGAAQKNRQNQKSSPVP